MAEESFDAYIDRFDEQLNQYIPPRSAWTPVEEALYGPPDLFRIPPAKAKGMQFRAIAHAFRHHYTENPTYRNFCQEHGVSPDDIKSPGDLDRIPLISDRFFKDYPAGKDFALWLGNIYTGSLPHIVIKGQDPTFEEVVSAFNESGLVICYSSGTGGRHTVIPRDQHTFLASQYAAAKSAANMFYPNWDYDSYGYLLMPNPRKTNIFAGKVTSVYFDSVKDVQLAIDRDISAEQMRIALTGGGGIRATVYKMVAKLASLRMVDRIIRWLEHHQKEGNRLVMVGPPFFIVSVMNRLQEKGKRLDLGQQGAVITGGGWKIYEDRRIPVSDFRRQVREVLGIAEEHCIDVYGMVEGNGWMIHCPEGHYLHAPYSYYKALVLDEEYKPMGYGEWGRFAFLDAIARSYPGFVMTGDKVRMLERCPVCDRPGPVLEPEVRRASGEEMRGCAEEVRHMVTVDLGG